MSEHGHSREDADRRRRATFLSVPPEGGGIESMVALLVDGLVPADTT